jgi:hypothetical protein
MAPVRITPAELARHLPRKGRVLVLGCAGESRLLADAVMAAGDTLGDLIFTGIFIPGINRHDYLAHSGCRVETFFYPRNQGRASEQVMFLPLCYNDIRARLQVQIDAALMMVAPDADGYCVLAQRRFSGRTCRNPVLIKHVPAILAPPAMIGAVRSDQPMSKRKCRGGGRYGGRSGGGTDRRPYCALYWRWGDVAGRAWQGAGRGDARADRTTRVENHSGLVVIP